MNNEEAEIKFSTKEARRFNKWKNDRLKNLSQVDFGKIYGELYGISIENNLKGTDYTFSAHTKLHVEMLEKLTDED